MTEDDAKKLYSLCRHIAKLSGLASTHLRRNVDLYRDGHATRAQLHSVLYEVGTRLGKVELDLENFPVSADWSTIEAVATRDGRKASVARCVLKLPRDILATSERCFDSSDEVFGELIHLIYSIAEVGAFPSIVEVDLLAEEGRVLAWIKEHGTAPEIPPPIVEFSPWVDSPEMIALMKLNGHTSMGDRTIQRYKQKWKAEPQPNTNNQKFRFHLPTLKQLGINPLPEWIK